jgi:hypothetical protein
LQVGGTKDEVVGTKSRRMTAARLYIEKVLLGRISNGQRRREFRFFLLAMALGSVLSGVFGAILYTLVQQGRL